MYGQQPGYGAPAPYGAPGAPQQFGPNGEPLQDGDRGLGKALLIGAGAAIAGVSAYAVYSKATKKKKKKVKTKNGKSREIDCDVLVDPNGNELAIQQFDESWPANSFQRKTKTRGGKLTNTPEAITSFPGCALQWRAF